MTNLSWRDYMRELLKMSDEAVMQALGSNKFNRDIAEDWVNGTNYTNLNGKLLEQPTFGSGPDSYIKITPKIKVEFECEKPVTTISKTSYSYNGNILSIDGSVDGKDCVLYLDFNSQEEQEKVFKQLIEAFGG